MLPVITIAREYGSGGHTVGIKLAKALNLPYYDKELIGIAAKESGLSEEVFAQVDEKAGSSLLYSMVMGSYPLGIRLAGNTSEMPINDQLFILQTNIIKKAAEEGPCVVIGRCGDYILREHENLFKIFIHAGMEKRRKWVIDNGLAEKKKANDYILKKDKQRSNYYNFYTNQTWNDMSNYNLTIDTNVFDEDKAVQIILEALKLR